MNIPLADALFLWDSGSEPRFAVRERGHPDYCDYEYKVGAAWAGWSALSADERLTQTLVDIWHVAAFYRVPINLIHEAMLVVPEYRDILANDVLEYRA